MSIKTKKVLASGALFVLFGFGISLQIKANIGQSMLNAVALTLSVQAGIKIGTILNLMNAFFWFTNICMRRFKANVSDLVQIIVTFANGFVINFFVYNVFGAVEINHYIAKLAVFMGGLALSCVTLGMLLAIGTISFPMESFCITFSKKINSKLSVVRFGIDVLFVATIFALVVFANAPLYIREGTVISFFVLSYLLGQSYQYFKTRLFLQQDQVPESPLEEQEAEAEMPQA